MEYIAIIIIFFCTCYISFATIMFVTVIFLSFIKILLVLFNLFKKCLKILWSLTDLIDPCKGTINKITF